MSIIVSMATENNLLLMSFNPENINKEFTNKNWVTTSSTIGEVKNLKVKHSKINNDLIREVFDGEEYILNSNVIINKASYQFLENNSVLVFHDSSCIEAAYIAEVIKEILLLVIENDDETTESEIISRSIDIVLHQFDELKNITNFKNKGKYILYSKFSKTIVGQLGYNRNGDVSLEYENDKEDLIIKDNCIVENNFYTYEIIKVFDYRERLKLCTVIGKVKNINGELVDLSNQMLSNKILKEISKKYGFLNVVNQHFIKKELIEGWKGELSNINKKNPRLNFLGYKKDTDSFDFLDYSTKKFGCEKHTYNLYFKDMIIYFEDSLIDMIESYLMDILKQVNLAEINKEEPKEIEDNYKITCLLFYLMNSLDEKKKYLYDFFKSYNIKSVHNIAYYELCKYIKKSTFSSGGRQYAYEFITVKRDAFVLNSNWSFNFHMSSTDKFLIAPLTPRHAFIFYDTTLKKKIDEVVFNIEHMLFNAFYLATKKIQLSNDIEDSYILFKNTSLIKSKIESLMNDNSNKYIANFKPYKKIIDLLKVDFDDYDKFYFHYNRQKFLRFYNKK